MLFLSLRTHFHSERYDFFQMNGKVRATEQSYQNRKDKVFFEKIAKQYNTTELKKFYIANFLEDRHYITDMTGDDAHRAYINYISRHQAISYSFSRDLDKMFDAGIDKIFTTKSTTYPQLIMMSLNKSINIESMVILNDLIKYTNKFDDVYHDDFVWPRMSLKIRKYKPFIHYDHSVMKKTLKEKLNGRSTYN